MRVDERPSSPVSAAAPPSVTSPRGRERRAALRDTPRTYERFYELIEKPFQPAPDPRFFYRSAPHERVGQELLTAIRKRAGLVMLTGDAGAGKTTLCRVAIEELDRHTLTSLIADPAVSADELLQQILADFGVLSRDELARAPL